MESFPRSCDHAWAAGFIDGEGCIAIKRRSKTNGYVLWVIVGQSGHERPISLKRLAALYGGSVLPTTRDPRPGRKPRWSWTIASSQAELCLRLVLPFLTEKREQALLALEYREKALGRGNGALAEEFCVRLQELKH
jgi:hypothetical protein